MWYEYSVARGEPGWAVRVWRKVCVRWSGEILRERYSTTKSCIYVCHGTHTSINDSGTYVASAATKTKTKTRQNKGLVS